MYLHVYVYTELGQIRNVFILPPSTLTSGNLLYISWRAHGVWCDDKDGFAAGDEHLAPHIFETLCIAATCIKQVLYPQQPLHIVNKIIVSLMYFPVSITSLSLASSVRYGKIFVCILLFFPRISLSIWHKSSCVSSAIGFAFMVLLWDLDEDKRISCCTVNVQKFLAYIYIYVFIYVYVCICVCVCMYM